jgi:UDP-GlcNAc:undecaprenyl-phosphate GlcNAc-1-phosphate transferase
MTQEIRTILTFLVAFFAALFVLPKLSYIANRIGLVDHPNERKVHKIPRPLVGGIGIVISATFSSLLFVPLQGLRGYFSGLALLLLVGFFDDFTDVGHRQKFLAQIAATALLMYLSQVYLSNFGNLLGFGNLVVPGKIQWLVWCVTIFCVVGVTNAINMIDGLDGLAGGVSFIAFISFAVLSSFTGKSSLILINLALAGAVLGFLRFNWSPSQLFMGDAGSLCLGFSLSFMAIDLTQGEPMVIRPVIMLLILAVPISDTITVMIRRIVAGKSPFAPDKTHLHHTLIRAGYHGRKAVTIILFLCLMFSAIAMLGSLYEIRENILFAVFLTYFVLNYWSDSLVRKVTSVFTALQRKDKPQHCPELMHSFFRVLMARRFFRGAPRYAVKMAITCTSYSSKMALSGEVLNLSETGFLAYINDLGLFCRECIVVISFPARTGIHLVELPAEHLWTASIDGKQYHGFRFLDLEVEQGKYLTDFLSSIDEHKD